MRNVVLGALMMFVAYECVEHEQLVPAISKMTIFQGEMNGYSIHLSEIHEMDTKRVLVINWLDDPDTSLIAVDRDGDWKWEDIYWYGVCEYNLTSTWTIAIIDYERNQIRFIPDNECPDQAPITFDQIRDTFVLMANAMLSVYNEAHVTNTLHCDSEGVAR